MPTLYPDKSKLKSKPEQVSATDETVTPALGGLVQGSADLKVIDPVKYESL